MTLTEKFTAVVKWYSQRHKEPVRQLSKTGRTPSILKVEQLTGLLLPAWYKELYATYDGEVGRGLGSFLGDSFLSMDEVVRNAQFAESLVKPVERKTDPSPQFNRTLDEINAIIRLSVPAGTTWHKIEFDVSGGSMGGPYLYETVESTRVPLELGWPVQKRILESAKELHALEKQIYNWDRLNVITYPDNFEIQRVDYDFTSQLRSTPTGAIRLKYFHLKWIPLLGDNGGNYIGVDFDPDAKGTLGQVIIFGRDEHEMVVLAPSFEAFLDLTLDTISRNSKVFLGSDHLHVVYSELIR